MLQTFHVLPLYNLFLLHVYSNQFQVDWHFLVMMFELKKDEFSPFFCSVLKMRATLFKLQ